MAEAVLGCFGVIQIIQITSCMACAPGCMACCRNRRCDHSIGGAPQAPLGWILSCEDHGLDEMFFHRWVDQSLGHVLEFGDMGNGSFGLGRFGTWWKSVVKKSQWLFRQKKNGSVLHFGLECLFHQDAKSFHVIFSPNQNCREFSDAWRSRDSDFHRPVTKM